MFEKMFGGNQVSVNGVTIKVPQRANVSIANGVVYVNGEQYVNGELTGKQVTNLIISGNVNTVDTTCSVTIEGSVHGNIDCGGSVDILGDVEGDIDCGGSVRITGSHVGDIDAGGSVRVR